MKPRILWITASAMLLLQAACNQPGKKDDTSTETYGVILPLTGELSSYADPMKQGMEMAKAAIDAKETRKIDLKFMDSKAEAKTAITALNQLTSVDHVSYCIGDISSTTTLAMVPVAESNHIFLLSPGASSPKLTGISKLFARNYPSSLDESLKSAEYAVNTLKMKQAAIVYVNSEFGLGLRDAFAERYQKLGGQLVLNEGYPFQNTDFKTLILKLKSANPGVIYLAGNQKEMGNFMKQLREQNLKTAVISNISFLEADCLNIAGPAAENVMVPVAYYDPKDSTLAKAYAFGKAYQTKYHQDPSVAVAVGYDAVMLIYDAEKQVGNDPQKVAAYIRDLKSYDGALGNFSFQNGDINMKTIFKIIKNGKPATIK